MPRPRACRLQNPVSAIGCWFSRKNGHALPRDGRHFTRTDVPGLPYFPGNNFSQCRKSRRDLRIRDRRPLVFQYSIVSSVAAYPAVPRLTGVPMNRATLTAAALMAFTIPSFAAPPSYTLSKAVPLGAPDRWDYVVFEPADGRVYIGHSTETTIVDGRSGAVVGHFIGLKGAHGTAIVPKLGR